MDDVLVVGAGPAGLAIAAALGEAGLRVAGLAPDPPDAPWENTYGVWADELAPLGLEHTLAHRWRDTVAYADGGPIALGRDYGLIDRGRLQAELLGRAERAGVAWQRGAAVAHHRGPLGHSVATRDGRSLAARLVLDASGHAPALLRRPPGRPVAYQAAYGVVGRFSRLPVAPGQLVLMDYRADHLSAAERAAPPTFLYAMDLGDGRAFVEETSLAHAPGLKLAELERRLWRRLAHYGVELREAEQIERCFFPMDAPLPDMRRGLAGFGAAAGLVHPASGYSVGAALRHARPLALAIAAALGAPGATPEAAAGAAWAALWPRARLQKRALYLFGLQALLRCRLPELQTFFRTFYALPQPLWAGYLADTLTPRELAATMLRVFASAPMRLRASLARSAGAEPRLLLQALA